MGSVAESPAASVRGGARPVDQRGLGESALDGSPARSLAEPGGAGGRENRRTAEHPSLGLAAADILALLDRLALP
ncbi:hypothetical protein [Saccharopolyspora sp. ASAGF58]|uniref:hypothetical protein n=1 Tax=Saccharopolyspora sp. ASAGF58 TaxID=2719023 RepID=UPI0035303014